MAATDALFWYAESALPTFRPIIAGLYILDRAPDPRRLEHGLRAALALVPRLRQRVVEAPWHIGLPEWVDDPHFDASYHVRHLSLPPPGAQRELLDLVATLFATPLDRERPLWEAYWIDGLTGGRSAYFFKLHHSVVDGVGAMALLNGLTQPARRAALPRIAAAPPRAAAAGALAQLADLAIDNTRAAVRLVGDAAAAPAHWLAHPGEAVAGLQATARGLRGTLADLRRPAISDPLAAGSSGLSRRFDVMQVPLARLHAIKEPLGVTINDLVLAVLAGALGAYHRERGVRVGRLNCMVPMNLRGRDEHDTLGNRVGTFLVQLPLVEREPDVRLEIVVQQTRAAKTDRRGAAAPWVLQAAALLPGFALRWIARQNLGKINVACTNVPGVRDRRYMAGALVEAVYPFASVVEGTPLVMALLSYGDVMHIGIDTDPEAIPDPHRLHALLDEELRCMEQFARRGEHAAAESSAPARPRRAGARPRMVRTRSRTRVASRRR
jgi:WS/DGAT/MGAT family acyltransferase